MSKSRPRIGDVVVMASPEECFNGALGIISSIKRFPNGCPYVYSIESNELGWERELLKGVGK